MVWSLAKDVLSFFPPADRDSLIITTRLGEFRTSTEVGRLDLDQALELLCSRSGLPATIFEGYDIPLYKSSKSAKLISPSKVKQQAGKKARRSLKVVGIVCDLHRNENTQHGR